MISLKKFLVIGLLFFVSRALADTTVKDSTYGTWGHGLTISNSMVKSMPFIRGWNFTFRWKDLEPVKGQFNWKLFDGQLKIAAGNNLNIGFMIWVGQHSPAWIYSEDGVQKVSTIDKNHTIPFFPYYLNSNYKKDYLNMIKKVSDHLKSLSPKVRNKLVFWMSAEGSSGDVTPYKGVVKDAKYDITDAQWLEFKKEAWTYMYQSGQTANPPLNILINPANNGQYFDYLVKNLPKAWFKAGSLAHTYQFDDELDYYLRMKRVVKPDNNGMDNRFRGESEAVQKIGWFKQSPQQNMFAIVASCLHIGLDILNVREGIVEETGGNEYPFMFFNQYAGQRNPATASGAFCNLRDVLDIADTSRFPENVYGKLHGNQQSKGKKATGLKPSATDGEEIKEKRSKEISSVRKQNILKEFVPFGAKNGTSPEEDKIIYKDDQKLEAKLRKENLRTDLQDKYNNDMGINLIPGNYYRFLEQYSPNTTSRGYWRVGPLDQPYGRYARGFDAKAGMNEMFFALDKNFFKDNKAPHKLQVKVVYFDKGNGEWSFNYYNGEAKAEKYRAKCTNTNRWIVKTVDINDAYISKNIEHNADFSLKYLDGDNTLFSMVEVLRQ